MRSRLLRDSARAEEFFWRCCVCYVAVLGVLVVLTMFHNAFRFFIVLLGLKRMKNLD